MQRNISSFFFPLPHFSACTFKTLFLIEVHSSVACAGHCLDVVCLFVSCNLVTLYEGFEIDM